MQDVALDLLILLAGVWLVAVTLRPLGLPTIMGELIVGVLVGPAVFGLIEPSEAITLLPKSGSSSSCSTPGLRPSPENSSRL
jgi:Kef-type K+ transport system membrane component KefB